MAEPSSAARAYEAPLGPEPAAPTRQLDTARLADHLPKLYRAAYGLCGSQADAEDLVQDTYERVLRKPRFLRHDEDIAYLLRVLRNTWISSGRRKRHPIAAIASEEIDTIADRIADPIELAVETGAVYAALSELPEILRETVVAVDVVGLSYKEAAKALGTKDGTIMSRLYRGREQIAKRIDGA